MSRIVLAPLLAGVLLVPAVLVPNVTPAAAAETTTRVTFGQAFGDYAYPLAEGKLFTIQRHVLDPGEVVRWRSEGTTVAIHQTRGVTLTNYPSCTSKQSWRAFPAYYVARSAAAGTLTGVTLNATDKQIELFTLVSEAVGEPQSSEQLHRHPSEGAVIVEDPMAGDEGVIVDPVEPATGGCPDGPEAETAVVAAGRSTADDAFEVVDHNLIAVYRHSVPAGWASRWRSPVGPSLLVPIDGEVTSQRGCEDVTPRRTGQAFVVDGPLMMTSRQGADFLEVMWNIPNGTPFDTPPYLPELPPTACPASAVPW